MKRLAILGVALAVFASAAPAAMADSTNWTNDRTLDCGTAGELKTVLNPAGFGMPFHDKDTSRVLIPLRVVVNGATVIDKPGVERNALSEITCSYDDPGGRNVVVTGILTPAAKS
jgi:hypothetical protein